MFKNKKIGIIGCGYFDKEMEEIGVDMIKPYNTKIFYWKVLLFIYFKLHLNWIRQFLYNDKWIDGYAQYDAIILFDGGTLNDTADICRKIENSVSKETVLIFYYWNTIETGLNDYLLKSNRWNTWTFDKRDSEKFNIRFANTFYLANLAEGSDISDIKYGVSFIGMNKGRLNYLRSLKAILEKHKIKTNFYIVEDGLIKKHKSISYKSVLDINNSSHAILEVQKPNQVGLTLRACEALFFKKKLITNNIEIKRYSFYNSQNILCLNDDDWEQNLESFMREKFAPIEIKIRNYYSFQEWLARLLKGEESKL